MESASDANNSRTKKPKNSGFNPILDLAEDETFEGESGIHPMSQFRSYLIGFLIIVGGISLFFGNAVVMVAAFVLTFLLYCSSLDSIAKLVKTLIEALIGLYVILIISSAVANIETTIKAIGAITTGSTAAIVNLLSPSIAFSNFIPWLSSGISYLGTYAQLAGVGTLLFGIFVILGSYFYTKGQRLFYTDRRLIITKRFGGSSTFQTTIDSISDVSSNTSLVGRMFGFGAVYITTNAGSGVYERDREGRPRPGRALQGVKLTADGIKEADLVANEITKLRMQFMDSLHLKDIKKYVKKTAEALAGTSKEDKNLAEFTPYSTEPKIVPRKKKKQQVQEDQQA